MKIAELFEARELEPPYTISKDEFEQLPAPGPSTIEDRFKVGKVAFDQRKGFGSVPNNRNVVYLGFVAEMKPSDFLKLAHSGDRNADASKFVGFIHGRAPMGSPTLYVSVNEDEFGKGGELRVRVDGHEGRARTTAFKQLEGDEMVPVHFILNGGMRARDLSEKFFSELRKNGIIREEHAKTADPTSVDIGRIFWMNKTL